MCGGSLCLLKNFVLKSTILSGEFRKVNFLAITSDDVSLEGI